MSLKKYVGDEASEAVITIHLYNDGNSLMDPHDSLPVYRSRPDVFGSNFIKFRTVIRKDGSTSLNVSADDCK